MANQGDRTCPPAPPPQEDASKFSTLTVPLLVPLVRLLHEVG
jgi:hypothetical protein